MRAAAGVELRAPSTRPVQRIQVLTKGAFQIKLELCASTRPTFSWRQLQGMCTLASRRPGEQIIPFHHANYLTGEVW